MTVLAIDPGPVESAWVMWDGQHIFASGKHPNEELAMHTNAGAECGHIVIEMIASYGMPVGREIFHTCIWIGRFIELYGAQRASLIVRGAVKMHLCHSMKAKDSNIRQALIDRFGAPGTKKNPGLTYGLSGDMWAAFALAVTWWDQYGAARVA